MKTAKILLLTLLFLSFSNACFAQGYMSVKISATAEFIYVQTVNALNGYLVLRTDVTHKVPYEIQSDANEKVLVIN